MPLLAIGIAIAGPVPVSAAQDCSGTVYEETFKGSLVVPAGALCELYDVDVRGDLSCWGNGWVGSDSGDNTVRGQKLGDCQSL